MGNIEIAKDLAKGIVDETEIQSRVVEYSPPAISSATSNVLLSGNLALADYAVTKNFATVAYTGNGSTQNINTGISSVDFTVSGNGSGYWLDRSVNQVKNDAGVVQASGSCVCNVSKVHIKSRTFTGSTVYSNWVFDGLRGVNKQISTNQTWREGDSDGGGTDDGLTNLLTDFTATGFNLGSYTGVNANTETYVAYQTLYTHIKWGTTNQGKFYVEAYNPVTREGMIYYIGSGLAGHEIPHSQGVELDFITTKNLDTVFNWTTATSQSIGYLRLNTTDALSNLEVFNFSNTAININDYSCGFSNGNEVIAYYKAKSETWTIVQYQGTGASGNFVETKDVYGVARKPRRVIVKAVSGTGHWYVLDSTRGDSWININQSIAEVTSDLIDIEYNGFTVKSTSPEINGSGGQYIALVEFDTNGDGGDSYFNLPTDDSNLNLTSGVFSYTNGIGSNGYNRSTESYTGSIDFAGMSDGKKWIAKTEGGSFVAYDKKPSVGMYEKTSADDNRLVFKDGKYYTTTGGELVTNGTFDSDTSGWSTSGNLSVSWSSGRALVNNNTYDGSVIYQILTTEIGKKYRIKARIFDGTSTANFRVGIALSDGSYGLYTGTQEVDFEFTANTTTTYISLRINSSSTGVTAYFDDIICYKLEPTLSTAVSTPISFLRNPVMVQSETPQYIDYNDELAQNVVESIEASGDIKANGQFVGKNACTAWVNFDGTTTPPTIRDSYNVSDVVRTGTGIYDVYFEEEMDNTNYAISGSANYGDTLSMGVVNVHNVHNNGKQVNKVSIRSVYANANLSNYYDIAIQVFGGKN